MAVSSYEDLAAHRGHRIVVVTYGDQDNAAVECETCAEVLVDFDRDTSEQGAIDCKPCNEHGGFEGDPPQPATVRVTLLRRPEYDRGQVTAAELHLLCRPHAVEFVGNNLEVVNGPHTLLIEHLTPTH
jgi:hypothetical protein